MSVTRVGATKQYSDNWENIFGHSTRPANPARQSTKKKAAKKKAGPKAVQKALRRK
jgi:hypothetical protein